MRLVEVQELVQVVPVHQSLADAFALGHTLESDDVGEAISFRDNAEDRVQAFLRGRFRLGAVCLGPRVERLKQRGFAERRGWEPAAGLGRITLENDQNLFAALGHSGLLDLLDRSSGEDGRIHDDRQRLLYMGKAMKKSLGDP
jgi:hypothetical protein